MKKPWAFTDEDFERDDFEDFEEEAWAAMKPNEFYFAFHHGTDDCSYGRGTCVVVVPKEYWDKEQCWYDQTPFMELITGKWPQYLHESMEAIFEVHSVSDAQCRTDLEALGLTYNEDLLVEI